MDNQLAEEFWSYLQQRELIVIDKVNESKGTELFKLNKGAQLELMEIMCAFEELISR